MLGAQTVLNRGWNENRIYIPSGFLRNAWNLFLPKGTCSVLLSVMTFIIHGVYKQEILALINEETKELSLNLFTFQIPSSFQTVREKEIFMKLFKRESHVQMVLERSGYQYPQTVEQLIQLLIHLGILYEKKRENLVYLDLIIEPFPFPEESLLLTTEDLNQAYQHRKMMTRQIQVNYS